MTGTAAPARDAFILGAGFSRAVSEHMPLTDELGPALVEKAPEVFTDLRSSQSFERWLTQRAEPQPFLSAADNLDRQALFTRAATEIAAQLDARTRLALNDPLPVWLGQLIALWHLDQSQVLTFNYDTLVECAFDTLDFWDWRIGNRFSWGSLINYNPRGMAGATLGEFDGSGQPHPSFRLWKLHGSTNWFWVPGDASGASAMRIGLPGRFGAFLASDGEDMHWQAPGRERLLVPPSALKSPYYANPVSREVWARGFDGLKRAHRITLMGYSMPQTDLTTVAMVQEAMDAGEVREVRVVDRAPKMIAERLRQVAPAKVKVVEFGGENPVPAYVETLVNGAGTRAIAAIQETEGPDDPRVVITWGDPSSGRGRSALALTAERSPDSETLTIRAGELTTFEGASAVDPGGPTESLTLRTLRGQLEGVKRIVAHIDGQKAPLTVIAAAPRHATLGRGDGTWLQLVPAEPPPS